LGPVNNQEQAADQNEQTILAYFKSASDAEKAAQQLQHSMNLSSENLKIDRFSGAPGGDGNDVISNPITGDITSLSTIAGGLNDLSSKDVGVLLAASPVASGMTDGSMNTISGRNFQLVAIVPKEQVESALKTIEQNGGIH
jgi:hypothetical protein